MRSAPARRVLSLALALSVGGPLAAQSVPIARQAVGGGYDVWLVGASGGTSQVVLSDVSFLPIALAGSPACDRLRLDLPTLQDVDGPAPHAALPGGGSLYRIGWEGTTAILHVRADGVPQVLLSVADAGAEPGLLERVFVTPDGTAALAASSFAAGGGVYLLDVGGGSPSCSLTAGLPPLHVDDVSLRASGGVAWFVAGGALYRAGTDPVTTAAPVDSSAFGAPVFGELAVASLSGTVAAVTGTSATDRRIVVVTPDGLPLVAAPTPGSYDLPGYDDTLGPFIAVSPLGDLVAYRQHVGTSTELFVYQVDQLDLPSAVVHLTDAPQFPIYIDNVGVLGFSAYLKLCFFAGDTQVSGTSGAELMGAADMYMADLSLPGAVTYSNLTQTNGQTTPPFTEAATLAFHEAARDPLNERFLLVGEDDNSQQLLATFALDSWAPPGVSTLVEGQQSDGADQLTLRALGAHVLVTQVLGEDDPTSPSVVLDLLPPLSLQPAVLMPLPSLPAGVVLDRWTSDHAGLRAACVASVAPGLEVPVFAQLDGALLLPAFPVPLGVAPALAFSASDQLSLGLGAPNGPYKFVTLSGPLAGKVLALPVGKGFPLSY